jgi:hypothetical protein
MSICPSMTESLGFLILPSADFDFRSIRSITRDSMLQTTSQPHDRISLLKLTQERACTAPTQITSPRGLGSRTRLVATKPQ